MFSAILKATNSSFQRGIAFCRSIYVKKVMKLLAFIFEQPSYYEKEEVTLPGQRPKDKTAPIYGEPMLNKLTNNIIGNSKRYCWCEVDRVYICVLKAKFILKYKLL